MKNLSKLINDKNNCLNRLSELRKSFRKEEAELMSKVGSLTDLIFPEQNGLDSEKIVLAESMVSVMGWENFGKGKTVQAYDDSIYDVAAGGEKILNGFFGCKDYSGWVCQRCDCEYGMGPRHGSIVFKISLTYDYQLTAKEIGEISEDDRNVILWYLTNYNSIFKARKLEAA